MAGGQQITVSRGTVTPSRSLPLSGSAVTLSQGSVTPNNDGVVPLVGESATVAAGTAAPGWAQALSGSALSASQGSVQIVLRPTDPVGQAITSAAGSVTAQGSGSSAHLAGVEATFAQGVVDGGDHAITGVSTTSAQGSPSLVLEAPISGSSASCSAGSVFPAQEADDTYITGSSGLTVALLEIALSGLASTAGQGDVAITGDAELALTGEESTAEAGTIAHDESFPLTGVSAASAIQSMGAPGGATLSGAEIIAYAGEVFTTGDRTFAITGASMTAGSGDIAPRPLIELLGQELLGYAQEFGPRSAELSGAEAGFVAGFVTVPQVRRAVAASAKRYYTYKGKRYLLTLDELARLIREDRIDITREDILVSYKDKKPHKLSKADFQRVSEVAAMPVPETDDDEDIEAIIALL